MRQLINNKNINKDIKAVFFDLDGTLFDTSHDLLVALNYILEKNNHKTITLSQLLPFISKGSKEIIYNLLKVTPNEQLLNTYKKDFITAYHQFGHQHTDFYPGIKKLINILNINKIPWGVITNKTESLARPLIKLFNLEQLQCKTFVCADTTAHAKPHPDPMIKACKDLNISADNYHNCIFIGDAITDIQAGKSINMITILASYGYIDPNEDIHSWGADLIIKSPLELCDYID